MVVSSQKPVVNKGLLNSKEIIFALVMRRRVDKQSYLEIYHCDVKMGVSKLDIIRAERFKCRYRYTEVVY